jgi:hypothetical protein
MRLLKPGDDLLVSRRSDGEAILAERPHLDRGAFDPQERSRCTALLRFGLAIGHGASRRSRRRLELRWGGELLGGGEFGARNGIDHPLTAGVAGC